MRDLADPGQHAEHCAHHTEPNLLGDWKEGVIDPQSQDSEQRREEQSRGNDNLEPCPSE
jgi:hypothetical protein